MAKRLLGMVAVLTGASSGIGRATALALSEKGVNLVLAARRKSMLEDVAKECRRNGVHVLVVPTDVTNPLAVDVLAKRAAEEFGHFDVWINNAGVTTIGRFQDVPTPEDRRLIETNLLGYIYGSKQAIRHFLQRGSGSLILVSSVAGRFTEPYAVSYSASKHAVRGLALSLREELSLEGHANIHVSTVLPPVVDTPLFQHAGNHMDHPLRALDTAIPAEEVAEAIVGLIEEPEAEVYVGAAKQAVSTGASLLPWLTRQSLAETVRKKHQQEDLLAPQSSGNLFHPAKDNLSVSGGWRKSKGASGAAPALFSLGAFAALAAWLVTRPQRSMGKSATITPFPEPYSRNDEERKIAVNENVSGGGEQGLDKTIADSFPSSDPPSTLPDPTY